MTALVTGATGLVGHSIAAALRRRGTDVRALVRTPGKPLPEGCEEVQGDLRDAASLRDAAEGCELVFHAAGLPEQWLPDAGTFREVNVEGTRAMLAAARAAGAERFVFTSTIDVFEADAAGVLEESRLDPNPKGTAYERSKQEADALVAAAQAGGLDAVFLHPAAVYGPGPAGSPGINELMRKLRDGEVPAIPPGGMPVVFSEDVGEGHVRAAERANAGDRFILCDRYVDNRALASAVLAALGRERVPPSLPLWLSRALASASEAVSRLTGKPPLVAKGQLHFLQWQPRPDASRARAALDLDFTPLEEGIARTLAFLEA
ncbi:MAG: SDR family oxidoreductase [Sandaracinaceae bacterium]